jgi:hypothetical protein
MGIPSPRSIVQTKLKLKDCQSLSKAFAHSVAFGPGFLVAIWEIETFHDIHQSLRPSVAVHTPHYLSISPSVAVHTPHYLSISPSVAVRTRHGRFTLGVVTVRPFHLLLTAFRFSTYLIERTGGFILSAML